MEKSRRPTACYAAKACNRRAKFSTYCQPKPRPCPYLEPLRPVSIPQFREFTTACGKLANWDRSGLGSSEFHSLFRNEPPVSKSSKSSAKNGGHIYIGI